MIPSTTPTNPQQRTRGYAQMIAAGCGTAKINPAAALDQIA
jgi:hypothetical protein